VTRRLAVMKPIMRTSHLLGILASAALFGVSARARADEAQPPLSGGAPVDKAACLDAVSKGQSLRDVHRMVLARDQFRVCARPECPGVVRADCATWAGEIEKSLPTLVLSAKDSAGNDATDVKVTADDLPLVDTLDGAAVAMDSGPHTLRFVRADGSTATQQVLVGEGEKLKAIAVVLALPPAVVESTDSSAVHPTMAAPSTPGGKTRLVGIVLGGAGVVTTGVGIGVAFAAKSKDNQAAGEGGAARVADSTSAVHEATGATVVFGVGLAMVAAGAVVWLSAPHSQAAVGTNGREVIARWTF
jgi:hypothetical protein